MLDVVEQLRAGLLAQHVAHELPQQSNVIAQPIDRLGSHRHARVSLPRTGLNQVTTALALANPLAFVTLTRGVVRLTPREDLRAHG